MPQLQLPIFPVGVTHLTSELAFMKREGQVTYFNGLMPVFTHAESDLRTFRMITSQFIINGNVKQSEVALELRYKDQEQLWRRKGIRRDYGGESGRRESGVLGINRSAGDAKFLSRLVDRDIDEHNHFMRKKDPKVGLHKNNQFIAVEHFELSSVHLPSRLLT